MYPADGSKLFYRVLIFKTRNEMLAHCRARQPGGDFRRTQACVASFEAWDERGTWPLMGEICFYLGYIDAGTVSHEMTHATMCWAHRKRLDLGTLKHDVELDERIAHVQGHMVDQFWERFYKLQARGVVRPAA